MPNTAAGGAHSLEKSFTQKVAIMLANRWRVGACYARFPLVSSSQYGCHHADQRFSVKRSAGKHQDQMHLGRQVSKENREDAGSRLAGRFRGLRYRSREGSNFRGRRLDHQNHTDVRGAQKGKGGPVGCPEHLANVRGHVAGIREALDANPPLSAPINHGGPFSPSTATGVFLSFFATSLSCSLFRTFGR